MENRGLQTSGVFGKRPIIGVILFIIGIIIFIALAYNLVKNGPLISWDLATAEYFHGLALKSSPLVINIMIFGYYAGLQGIEILAILLGLYFLLKRLWKELVILAVASGGGGLLFLLLSHIFNRPRPFLLFDKTLLLGVTNFPIPGFPSGHTIGIIIFCGFLVYLLLPKIKSYLGKVLTVLIAIVITLYIGLSRLYVGDHYLTDVIAGYAVGLAWFGLTVTLIELLFRKFSRKEKNKHEKE